MLLVLELLLVYLAKHPMGVVPKIGIIGGIGASYTVLYRMTMESMGSNISNSNASVSVSPVQIKLETVANQTFNGNTVNSLVNSLEPFFPLPPGRQWGHWLSNMSQFNRINFTESSTLNKIFLQSKKTHSNSQIISALDQQNPN